MDVNRIGIEQTSENGPFAATDLTARLKVVHSYLSAGGFRYEMHSNPFRGGSPSAPPSEATMGWTRDKYDCSGRLREHASFAGAANPGSGAVPNKATSDYPSNEVRRVCDEAANLMAANPANPGTCREFTSDALGRLVAVKEPGLGANFITTYVYDHVGSVWTVTPPDALRARSFLYDPLGRLTQAANPENGTLTYAYDDNGNLIDRRDAALAHMCVVSAMSTGCDGTTGYDPLNRPLRKNYTSAVATPSVVYSYGQDLSGGGTNYYKGRLSAVTAGTTTVSYNRYDAVGRVMKHTQTTDGVPYVFLYDYNVAGLNTSITYPSGRQGTTNYVSGAAYAPHGAMSQSLSGGSTRRGAATGGCSRWG